MSYSEERAPPMSVREFYQEKCEPGELDCGCYPDLQFIEEWSKPCAFIDKDLVMDINDKFSLMMVYLSEKKLSPEAFDFLKEFPIFVLKKGTTICHSTDTRNILQFNQVTKEFATQTAGWWNKFFVGQSKYNGGWFTYETNYGGPGFGFLLYYKVEQDIPLLFVPNYAKKARDPRYFPEDAPDPKEPRYTGSHIVQGVKNWKDKGYKKIVPKYFADEFAERIVQLGFPGYISCDECEIFLTHETMKKSMPNPPYRVAYGFYLPEKCRICDGKEFHTHCASCSKLHEPGFEKCTKCSEELNYQTAFDIVVSLLCSEKDNCPLQITPGKRTDYDIDLQKIPKELIEKSIPYEKFFRKAKQYVPTLRNTFYSDLV